MKDIVRMNQLAGIITEGQAKKMMAILNEEIKFIDANDPGRKSGGTEYLKPQDLQPGKTVIIKNKSYRDRSEVEAEAGVFTRIDDKGNIYWKTKDGKEMGWQYIEDLALVKNL